jgi:hypothetical protein
MAGVNSYTYIKAIAEELRGLAVEFEIPIMTATQINRDGFNDKSPDMTSTSECLDPYSVITEKTKGDILLKDVSVGDEILSHDGYKVVRMKHCPKIKKSYRIKMKSGKEIICSADHVFPTKDGRMSINDGLKISSKISSY